MEAQLEKIIGEQVKIIKVDSNFVDFKTLDGIQYWAKLTSKGKVKANSIRIVTAW